MIRRLYSSKSLSCNSYVAITSASKKIALVTSVAVMIPPKAAPSATAQARARNKSASDGGDLSAEILKVATRTRGVIST